MAVLCLLVVTVLFVSVSPLQAVEDKGVSILRPPAVYDCVSTPVVNQACSNSWAYASTAMFESAILLKDSVTVKLSEAWLVDCNPYGWDCNDGWFANDIFFRDGAVLAANYPGVSCSLAPISYQAQGWRFCENGYSVASTDSIKTAICRRCFR